jgi:hypothetical protein
VEIIRQSPHKIGNLGQPILRRNPPRREMLNQIGNPGIGPPVAKVV